MQKKFLFLLCLVYVGGMSLFPLQAQTSSSTTQDVVIIYTLSGVESQTAIAKIGKMTFAEEEVCLIAHDGAILACEPISTCRAVVFDKFDVSTFIHTIDKSITNKISIYPNPAVDVVNISGLVNVEVIRIYGVDGSLISSIPVDSNKISLSVSHLADGVYYLQINTQILKLLKQ